MDSERPEILPVEAEREILMQRLIGALSPAQFRPDVTVAEGWDAIALAVVTQIIHRLQVMSARQLAVLLAGEASRHGEVVIHEPPHYTKQEISDAWWRCG